MDRDLTIIRETLHAISGQLAAYEMLGHALIATHPNRPRLLDAFTKAALQADTLFGKQMDDPAQLRTHFDAACNQIVSALRTPGRDDQTR